MRAEALRELGEHEEANAILSLEFPEDYRQTVAVIRDANDRGETQVIEIV